MGFEWKDIVGIGVVGLLIIIWGLTIAGIKITVGFDVLATAESAVGYLAAGNFSEKVLLAGILTAGIFNRHIFISNRCGWILRTPCNGTATPHSYLKYEGDELDNDCNVI